MTGTDINYKLHRLLKPVRFCFAFVFISFGYTCNAQYERVFSDSLSYINVQGETYDGGILIEELNDTLSTPTYLVKYTLEGKELWGIQFRNTFELSALVTKDSGFIVAANVYMNPAHISTSIALVKFDKCCKMQWAKYVPGNSSLPSVNNHSMIEDNGNFYLLGYGIATMDQNHGKPITVLKFSQNGDLLNYKFLPGDNSLIYKNVNEDTVYIDQDIYIPLDGDTDFNVFYLYSGIHAIDTSLIDVGQALVGYPDIQNGMGSLIVNNASIQAFNGTVQSSNGVAMLTDWNKSLVPMKGKPYYDGVANYDLGEVDASALNDSIVVLYNTSKHPHVPSYFYTSLRLYNDTLKPLNQYNINKGNEGQTSPSSFIRLKNGNMILSSLNYNDTTGQVANTSFYLFDRKLDPLLWPTTPPAKGYDWACTKNIPASQIIYLDSIVKPVNVVPDNSMVDWEQLIKSAIPENAVTGRIENGWLLWPQPALTGSPLYLQCQSNNASLNFQGLDVIFYDARGKQVSKTTAMLQSANKWVIPSLNLPCPGVYMANLLNKRTGMSLGMMKVVVE